MSTLPTTINTFVQNTCVIVVFAYVLTRTRLMQILFSSKIRSRDILILGGVFGLMGLLELYFASSRFPYDTYTLIITFATVNAGLRVGILTASMLVAGSFLFLESSFEHRLALSVLSSLVIAWGVRRATQRHHRVVTVLVAMLLAEIATIALRLSLPISIYAPLDTSLAFVRLSANAVGTILLQLIVNDAQTRAQAEHFRAEAEHSRTLAVEAQLVALRARINPHFLYNTLSSIAGLCSIAPDKAEETIAQLGHIMRRSMEINTDLLVTLRDEIEYTREYVEIEQLRFGEHVSLAWNIQADCLQAKIPPFSVQLLVENAINHGIGPKPEPGVVTVTVRRKGAHILVAVQDDGVGMSPADKRRALQTESSDRHHGLQLLSQQLTLMFSAGSRLHLFTAPDQGTCAAFCIPAE